MLSELLCNVEGNVIVQQISSERVVLLGWSRAILMQMAHPLIAAGVIQHSSFRGGMIDAAKRLHHTVAAMLSLAFGDDGERAAAVARIRGIHRSVNGTLDVDVGRFRAGTPYSAENPALLLWVHATLLDSTADVYQRIVSPLTDCELDALCVESAPLLEELGGDPAATPRSWSALRTYVTQMEASGDLVVSSNARALGDAVLSPRAAGLPLPLSGALRLLAAGLLSPPLRQAYGFQWDEAREARFQRALRALRLTRRWAPDVLVHWPQARRA
jgi:uncharacterized protein (DUF2236 family)